MTKILTALCLILAFVSVSYAETGYEYELGIKKRTGLYTATDISLDQIVIELTKMTPSADTAGQDGDIAGLFELGEQFWFQVASQQTFISTMFYSYKKLCDAVIGFYKSSGRLYMAVPYLRKLLADSRKRYVIEVEADTVIRLSDVYLTLGQLDAAKELLVQLQSLIDEFFTIDITDIEGSDAYSVVLNSEFRKQQIRLALIEGDSAGILKAEQDFFDFLLAFYKHTFYTPFMQLTGMLTNQQSFIQYDEATIGDYTYYTNYETMYSYARLFAANGDSSRAMLALAEAEKGVRRNGGGDIGSYSILKADSTAHKEIMGKAGITTSTEVPVLKRVPYRFDYLESLYRTVVLAELGDYENAAKSAKMADERYAEMTSYYSTLPKEYSYNDNISDSLPQQILAGAKIQKSMMNFAEADRSYLRLTEYYEKVRDSIPMQLRRGFFRGYSKGAYIGLIENRAQMYLAKPDKAGFEKFVRALDRMNARQYRELSGQDRAPASLEAIQRTLGRDDLVYIILDADEKIITAGITADKTGIDIVPKEKKLEHSLQVFKSDLVNARGYDMAKLTELTAPILAPIAGYKAKGKIHALIDGAVSILPLSIYPLNGRMLFENYSVDYMVTLDMLKQSNTALAKGAFLGIADPVYDKKAGVNAATVKVSMKRSAAISGYFDPLPETREEVRQIAAGMAMAKLLLGSEASESVVKNMPLDKYSIIHFATHGILGGEIPGVDEPALVLSGEQGEDSLLKASEISALKMKADLVVLSACNTGSGQYFRGEGVTGIARAFKLAGTDTVVASLWPVDSIATKKLMELFYKYIEDGKPVSQALYLAKKHLQTEGGAGAGERALKSKKTGAKDYSGYSNPYFWSAFVVISS